MKNVLVTLLVLFVAFPIVAEANSRAERQLADRAAAEILLQCRETDDKRGCLERRGAVCEFVEGKKREEYRCVKELTFSYSKVGYAGNTGSTGGEATFELIYRVYLGKKGWRASKKTVRRVKD